MIGTSYTFAARLALFGGLIVAAAGAAHAAGPFDGVYTTTIDVTKNSGRKCIDFHPHTIRVRDSGFRLPWQGAPIEATVQPDGSFSGQSNTGMLTGKIAGGHLDANLVGQACGYHIVADKG